MMQSKNEDKSKAVKGQDFEKPKGSEEKPSSHGELANQKEGDFTELEESRMDNPPKKRLPDGSESEE